MLCTVVVVACLAALLNPASSHSTRPLWFDSEDSSAQESVDEPTWRLPTKRELGDELIAAKRALSVLSRWKPFTDTLRSAYPSRAEVMSQLVPRAGGVEVETRGSLRPPGQPLRWGR